MVPSILIYIICHQIPDFNLIILNKATLIMKVSPRLSNLIVVMVLYVLVLISYVTGDRKTAGKAKCRLKRSTGNCRASISRYYFDMKSLRCEEFIFGGCGGNAKHFKSRKECERQCAKYFSKSEGARLGFEGAHTGKG